MVLIGILIILIYYFINIKPNERATFIVSACLSITIMISIIISMLSPVDSIFYKELDKESISENLIDISYTNSDEPSIENVTNTNGNKIIFNSNGKIGILSDEDKNIEDEIIGNLKTTKINYTLKNSLIKYIYVIPTQKQYYIYDIISYEIYNYD